MANYPIYQRIITHTVNLDVLRQHPLIIKPNFLSLIFILMLYLSLLLLIFLDALK